MPLLGGRELQVSDRGLPNTVTTTAGRQKQVEGSYSSGSRDLHKAGVIL